MGNVVQAGEGTALQRARPQSTQAYLQRSAHHDEQSVADRVKAAWTQRKPSVQGRRAIRARRDGTDEPRTLSGQRKKSGE